MTTTTNDWTWFEPLSMSGDDLAAHQDASPSVSVSFARCFGTPDGERVLGYLRRLTLDRSLGPNAPDQLLRHIEGQRQLVVHILGLVAKGMSNE
ncbi:MAG: hypothetical protein IPK66_02740 [Rhodospirillales bacterium]|nr:hypothetical protein [Rhodospirillales bacterium]